MAASNSKLIDLRQLLAERFPQNFVPGTDRLETGLPAIDALGGLPKNAITELTSPNPSGGSALLFHLLLRNAYQHRFFVALIDGSNSFDPHTAGDAPLRHLLWVRCSQAAPAVQAADLLLRDGNFPLVVLDLVLNAAEELRKIPQTHWYRLQRLVETAPTAFLVLTRRSMIGSAQLKLSLTNSWRLADLERFAAPARLDIHVERKHGGETLRSAG
jgi:hypothetical protein